MSRTRLDRVIQAVISTPWAIMPEKLEAVLQVLALRSDGLEVVIDRAAVDRAAAQKADNPPRVEGKVAVLPMFGMLSRRMNMMSEMSGGTSLEQWRAKFDAMMANPDVKAIVLQVDSPGGDVAGTPELAQHIYESRNQGKRIVAVADTMAASAAYWIAAAADELVVTPSGYVGSVGVFAVHVDESKANEAAGINYTIIKAGKYKAEGMSNAPLSQEALDYTQANIDRVYNDFTKSLATFREVSPGAVRADFGEGRIVDAQAAVAAGMADRVATFEQTMARLGVGATGVGNVKRSRVNAVDRTVTLEGLSSDALD